MANRIFKWPSKADTSIQLTTSINSQLTVVGPRLNDNEVFSSIEMKAGPQLQEDEQVNLIR